VSELPLAGQGAHWHGGIAGGMEHSKYKLKEDAIHGSEQEHASALFSSALSAEIDH
jgi:hypothetical protein